MEIIPGKSLPDLYEKLKIAHQQAMDDEIFRRKAVGVLLASRSPLLHAYECPNCGRLAIANGDDPNIVMWFVREPGPPDRVLSIRALAEDAVV